jgi:hypothetical protein
MEESNDLKHDEQRIVVPFWMKCVIILCMLPGLMFPWLGPLLASDDVMIKSLTWFYPLYIVASGCIAWQCYGRRTIMSWIILVLMLLSHLCFYYLAFIVGNSVSYA